MTLVDDCFRRCCFFIDRFSKVPGEFISFPKGDNSKARSPEVWKRGDYELLSKTEMKDGMADALVRLSKADSGQPSDLQTLINALVATLDASAIYEISSGLEAQGEHSLAEMLRTAYEHSQANRNSNPSLLA